MARIESLERRQIEAIAARIEKQLGAAVDVPGVSSLSVKVAKLDNVDHWRKAVRLVARRHGWKVRTGVSHGTAWAIDVRDQPPEIEDALNEQAMERLDAFAREASKPKLRRI